MIADLEKPDSGEFIIGKTAKIGYMEQMRDTLTLTKQFMKLLQKDRMF